jgi:hypothetical protein
MDRQDFIEQGAAMYGGHGWKTRLAADLGVHRKTIHSYTSGDTPIPRRVELAMETLRASRVREIEGASSAPAVPTTMGSAQVGAAPSPSGGADRDGSQ